MAEFRPVGRVQVSLWGRKVGVLVPSPERGYCAFKFDRSFLGSGIQIAPLMMPLAEGPYQFADLPRNAYEGLPPCFADSLPDGFGNSLIRRWARERKYDIDELPATVPRRPSAFGSERGITFVCTLPSCTQAPSEFTV